MDKQMTPQEVARATLDSIEMVRRACEGKPKQKPAAEALADIFGDDPDLAWMGGLFMGKGGKQ